MKRKSTATKDRKLAYNLAEASEVTGLGEWSLKRAVQRKELKVFKPTGTGRGTPMLFLPNDLEEFVMKGERS